jgi:multidrug efflux pump subunit AcrA (membrane-fusion protein)
MERDLMDHDQAVKSQVCEKYLLGELSPELRDAYEEHYFSCAECAMQLRTAAELIGASQQILARTPAIGAKVHAEPQREGWFKWLQPAIAIPMLASLLLLVGYQNFVTIPHLKKTASPRVLPMFSLISANTRSETAPEFVTQPDEPLGLYVDVPVDATYSTYNIRLQDPNGKTIPLRSLSYAEAQKTQVVVVNPGKRAGNYVIVVSGLAEPGGMAASAKELARLQFTVEFTY